MLGVVVICDTIDARYATLSKLSSNFPKVDLHPFHSNKLTRSSKPKFVIRIMGKLSDIPNEIIIAISSHLRKPSDILHLVLSNHRMHSLIIALLYEHIAIDENFTELSQTSFPNTLELAHSLSNNSFGSSIRGLELILDFPSQ